MGANGQKKISTRREDTARAEDNKVRYANREEVLRAVKKSLPATKDALEYLKNR